MAWPGVLLGPLVLLMFQGLNMKCFGQNLIGCFPEDPTAREFSQIGSDYNPSLLTPRLCRFSCNWAIFRYAAVTAGRLCLCGYSYGNHGASDVTQCNLPCLGNASETCGGHLYNQVYSLPEEIQHLHVVDTGVISAYSLQSITVNQSMGIVAAYSLDYGDGSALAAPQTVSNFSHIYKPGEYVLSATAVSSDGDSVTTTKILQVEAEVRGVSLFCEEFTKPNDQFECELIVDQGSGLTVDVDFNDGHTVSFTPAAALDFTVGNISGTPLTGSGTTGKLDFLLNHIIMKEGTLVGWEFYGKSAGRVFLQVWRPYCPTEMEFCPLSYTCVSTTSYCSVQPSRWSTACTGNTAYSISQGACVDKTTHTVVRDYITSPYQLGVQNFSYVGESTVNIVKVGQTDYVGLSGPDVINVEIGDVIAVFMDTGELGRISGSTNYEFRGTLDPTEFLLRNTDGMTFDISTTTAHMTQMMVKAHLVQPSLFVFQHTYCCEGTHFVSVNITNQLNIMALTDQPQVQVQEPVSGTRVNCTGLGRTNFTQQFNANVDTGTKVVFTWDFGDGETFVTLQSGVSHIYASAGVYKMTVVAENNVSAQASGCEVMIQDVILGLNVTPAAIATVHGSNTIVTLTILQGSNVTYNISTGDGRLISWRPDESLLYDSNVKAASRRELTATLEYLYSNVGNYSFIVNACNLVSEASTLVFLPVETEIQNFSIVQPQGIIYNESAKIHLQLVGGSGAWLTASFGQIPVLGYNLSQVLEESYLLIEPIHVAQVGASVLTCNVTNLVSAVFTYTATILVDYRIEDLTIIALNAISCLGTNQVVNFNISMKWGTRFSIQADYGDGTTATSSTIALYSNLSLPSMSYAYPSVGNYTVHFNVSNPVSWAMTYGSVYVVNPVTGIVVTTNSPVTKPPAEKAEAFFSIVSTGISPPPGATSVHADFGDGVAMSTAMLLGTSPFVVYHNYTISGTFNANITVFNCFNSETFNLTLDVDEPILNFQVLASHQFVQVSEVVNVSATLSVGPRVLLRYDFGDASPPVERRFSYVTNDAKSYTYNLPGTYTIVVTASNSVGSVSASPAHHVKVQYPTAGISLECQTLLMLQVNAGFTTGTCDVFIQNGVNAPTGAVYTIDYGNGATKSAAAFTSATNSTKNKPGHFHYLSFNTTYTEGNSYEVKLHVRNNVSDLNATFVVNVMEVIDGLRIEASYTDNITGGMRKPGGSDGSYLPSDEPITFMAACDHGSHVSANWNFGDGSTGSVFNISVPSVVHWFHFSVSLIPITVLLTAQNNISSATSARTFNFQRSIKNTRLTCPNPFPANITVTCILDFGSVGTKACYRIDFADDASPENRYVFFGNSAQCQMDYPSEWAIMPRRYTQVNETAQKASGNPVPVDHMFVTVGSHWITLTTTNFVSREEHGFRMSVTKGPCYPPLIDIATINYCDAVGTCSSHMEVMRSKAVLIYSQTEYNCTFSNRGYFQWRVYKIDGGTGRESEITNLQATQVNGTGLEKLRLGPRVLPYGHYRVSLNVSMIGEEGIDNVGNMQLRIIETPLTGQLSGGPYTSVKWNTNYTFDAQSYTFDPDLDDPADKTGMTFQWLCKRHCELWPVFDNEYNILAHNGTRTCSNYDATFSHTGGCHKTVKNGYPGPMTSSNSGLLSVDTYYMYEEEEINFIVVVRKGTRKLVIYQTVLVSLGDPPEVNIRCRTNCGTKMNPSSRFSVESYIHNYRRGMQFKYRWNITTSPSAGQLLGSRPIYPAHLWCDMASTGTQSANLALDPGTFGATQQQFLLEVHCARINSNSWGIGSYSFGVNAAPDVGNCSILPDSGTALKTNFSLNCSEAFSDPDTPINYQVSFRVDQQIPVSMFQGLMLGDMKPFQLPMGESHNNFTVIVNIRAVDAFGSFVDLPMTVQVLPMPQREADQLLANLTATPTALYDVLNIQDSVTAVQTVSTLASLLNSAQGSGTEGWDRTSAADGEKEKRVLVRGQMIDAINSLSPSSMEDIQRSSSALCAVTSASHEMSEDSQDKAIGALLGMTALLSDIADQEDGSADTLENTGTSLLTGVGNMLQATSGGTGTSTETLAGVQRTKRNVGQLMAMINSISDAVMSKKVAGEKNSVLRTATLDLTVFKQFTDRLGSKVLDAGHGNTFGMPSIQSIYGNNSEKTDFLMGKVLRIPVNPYTWSTVANESEINTEVTELSMKNDTNEVFRCHDLPEDFEITLQRAAGASITVPTLVNVTRPYMDTMLIHKVDVRANSSLHIQVLPATINETSNSNSTGVHVKTAPMTTTTVPTTDVPLPENRTVRWLVYVRRHSAPDDRSGEFDFNCTLPLSETEIDQLKLATPGGRRAELAGNLDQFPSPNINTCFLSNDILNMANDGQVYIGIRQIYQNYSDLNGGLIKSPVQQSAYGESLYALGLFCEQCSWWDPDNEIWSSAGCKVGPLTERGRTQCLCNHLTVFGSGFAVPMNTIDLSDSAFLKLDENPVVFATMVVIMGLYLLLLIWARKADKMDELKAGVTPLHDNDPRDKYLYEILVCTGTKKNAGTTAKVRIVMSGDQSETEPRLLWDDKRPVLQQSGMDAFLMSVPEPLGDLSYLRVWHDNGGKNPSWYFSRMQVTDLQTGVKYFFLCDRWLAVEEDDGMVDRILPVAGISELTSFDHLFWKRTRKDLSDSHIWFSVFRRPARSRFTRVQRLTCCLSLLFCSMMANILFYKTDQMIGSSPQRYRLGPINFTMAQLYIGLMSGIIAFPANVLIVAIFRSARQRTQKIKPDWTKRQLKPVSSASNMESELQQQREFLDSGGVNKLIISNDGFPASGHGVVNNGTKDYTNLAPVAPAMSPPILRQPSPKDKKKCRFNLPWWFVYVGYFLCLCTVGAAFFLTVEVAGVFGQQKSQEWLLSFCLSILESIFLMQPLKVLFLALFYALITRDPADDEDDHEDPELKDNEAWLHQHHGEPGIQNLNTLRDLGGYQQPPAPPDQATLKAAREKRMKEIQMFKIIREILVYLVFLYLLMMVGYGNRDPWSYHVYKSLNSTFRTGSYNNHVKHGSLGIMSVHSRHTFWTWVSETLLPALYSTEFYDGNSYMWLQGHVADNQAYLIGEARLRLHRIRQETCLYPITKLQTDCNHGYSFWNQDETSYKQGWMPVNGSDPKSTPDAAWQYRTASELDGYLYWGNMATYSGGGYVASLGRTMATANATLRQLIDNSWLDEYTRVVFVEFLLYNPNVNLFSVSMIAIEIPETGASYPYFKIHTMRLNRYVGSFMFVVLVAELFSVIFIFYFLIKETRSIIKQKMAYFKSFWNIFELLVLGLCISAIVMAMYRLVIANNISNNIHDNPNSYHNFQYVVIWDEVYGYLVGIIVFLSTIKFLRLLRFNRRMSVLSSTLHYASKSLLQFSTVFAVMFLAFAQIAYLIFNSRVLEFSTFVRTIETLSVQMLNKFDFNSMVKADRVFGPTIFFFFALIVSFVLINFFLTIIIDAYLVVKHDVSKQSNEYEIVDFIIGRFKAAIGFGSQKKNKDDFKIYQDQNDAKGVSDARTDLLRKRLDALCARMEELMRSEDKEVFKQLQDGQKRKRFFLSD